MWPKQLLCCLTVGMRAADYTERSALPRLQVLWEWTSKSVARRCHDSCSRRLPQGGSARRSLMRFNIASFTTNVSAASHSKYCGYVKQWLWAFCCSVRSHLTYMLILCLLLCGLKPSSRFRILSIHSSFVQIVFSAFKILQWISFILDKSSMPANDVKHLGQIIDKYTKYDLFSPIWHCPWKPRPLMCASVQGCVVKGLTCSDNVCQISRKKKLHYLASTDFPGRTVPGSSVQTYLPFGPLQQPC